MATGDGFVDVGVGAATGDGFWLAVDVCVGAATGGGFGVASSDVCGRVHASGCR